MCWLQCVFRTGFHIQLCTWFFKIFALTFGLEVNFLAGFAFTATLDLTFAFAFTLVFDFSLGFAFDLTAITHILS